MSNRGRDSIQPVASSVALDDSTLGFDADTVQEGFENVDQLVSPLVVPIPLIYNGTVNNNEYIGYSNLLSGDLIPIIAPITGTFVGFTFSNRRVADFDLEFIKGATTNTPFYTWSVTSTKFDVYDFTTPQPCTLGDQIYIRYKDKGTDATDIAIVLKFKS